MTVTFSADAFAWFEGLESNNEKTWFDANRRTWEREVRDPFAAFLVEISERLADSPLPVRGGKQTMFRINRDIRFSADKRPYSETVSGLLTPDGTKDGVGRLLYLELGADGGRVGGGMHQPKAADLASVRRRMIEDAEAFDAVLATLASVDVAFDDDVDAVATMPRGFGDHAEHRHAGIIRRKQLLAMRFIPREAYEDGTAADRVVEAANGIAVLYDFIDGAR